MSPRSGGPRSKAEAMEMVTSHLVSELSGTPLEETWGLHGWTEAQVGRLQDAVEEVSRRLCLVGKPRQRRPAPAVRVRFSHLEWHHRFGTWMMDLRRGDEVKHVPVSFLTGRTVNIGDKDGWVYEGVTVTGFDPERGFLTLEGGACGRAFSPKKEARPLEHAESLSAHDVARGYVHPDPVV